MHSIGLELDRWMTADEVAVNGRGGTALGQTVTDSDGRVYVRVMLSSDGVTGAGYVVTIDQDFVAVMLSRSNDDDGNQLGVALGAGSEDDIGWVQVYGPASVMSAANAPANAFLGPAPTAGRVGAADATGLYIDGIVFRTATGGVGGMNTSAFLNWPRVATRMGPAT